VRERSDGLEGGPEFVEAADEDDATGELIDRRQAKCAARGGDGLFGVEEGSETGDVDEVRSRRSSVTARRWGFTTGATTRRRTGPVAMSSSPPKRRTALPSWWMTPAENTGSSQDMLASPTQTHCKARLLPNRTRRSRLRTLAVLWVCSKAAG
jgi:hypothetical protein